MNPYLIAGSVLALIASYAAGRFDQSRIETGKQAAVERAVQRAKDEHAENVKGIADEYEGDREKRAVAQREVRTEVTRIVTEKPVYRDVCLDADGVRVTAQAVRTDNGDAGEPAPTVPEAPRAQGRGDDGRPGAVVPD